MANGVMALFFVVGIVLACKPNSKHIADFAFYFLVGHPFYVLFSIVLFCEGCQGQSLEVCQGIVGKSVIFASLNLGIGVLTFWIAYSYCMLTLANEPEFQPLQDSDDNELEAMSI
eukprot:CAMPEP_0115009764 /NCGR_PEP_ID=MMETSP0216-20121206/22853_1 /TAXON_ID=223996 /ORGANISM="Protocruzia adherens, Strain Boccale" /LENGTH=114 /DNA_ID=CAMNT_0002377727 /DNA_START=320 /DNA_END=664 /DNA_ORIENTATION=+